MKSLGESSIVICGIVKNAEIGLLHNISVINQFCKLAKDFKVVIYENDSKDHTKYILKKWSDANTENIFAICENNVSFPEIPLTPGVNPFFSARRISKMVSLRNKYMDFVEEKGWNPDYLIVADLDVGQLNLSNILTSFDRDIPEFDCMTAYGYSTSPRLKRRYHDTFALVLNSDRMPQNEFKIHKLADEIAFKCKKESKPFKVKSAFGGLAIYRYEAIKKLRYQLIKNNDSRVEVCCEHFSLNRQMAERGFDRIYINPRMKLLYQGLSIPLMIKYLKRLFFNSILF